MDKKYEILAEFILKEIGIEDTDNCLIKPFASNTVETKQYNVNGTKVSVEIAVFDKTCRVETKFLLPENGVTARTFMEHCAGQENIPKNHGHHYCHGPKYRDYSAELHGKNTEAFSPWNNQYFIVWSEGYLISESEEAVKNCAELARKFSAHLEDFHSMRYWNPTDKEVIAKAKEIIANADFQETDVDREEKAHMLKDKNSFFKGWFSPFNDKGRGTFDTLWPSSVDYAASAMGNEGSFEYAVSCILLENPEYIAKARKACRIVEETRTYRY